VVCNVGIPEVYILVHFLLYFQSDADKHNAYDAIKNWLDYIGPRVTKKLVFCGALDHLNGLINQKGRPHNQIQNHNNF